MAIIILQPLPLGEKKGGADEGAISLARGLVELIIHAAQPVVQTLNW